MTGFSATGAVSQVSHMYGNKRFSLEEARVLAQPDGSISVHLRSRRQRDKSPVELLLSPADALRIGTALVQYGGAEVAVGLPAQ